RRRASDARRRDRAAGDQPRLGQSRQGAVSYSLCADGLEGAVTASLCLRGITPIGRPVRPHDAPSYPARSPLPVSQAWLTAPRPAPKAPQGGNGGPGKRRPRAPPGSRPRNFFVISPNPRGEGPGHAVRAHTKNDLLSHGQGRAVGGA